MDRCVSHVNKAFGSTWVTCTSCSDDKNTCSECVWVGSMLRGHVFCVGFRSLQMLHMLNPSKVCDLVNCCWFSICCAETTKGTGESVDKSVWWLFIIQINTNITIHNHHDTNSVYYYCYYYYRVLFSAPPQRWPPASLRGRTDLSRTPLVGSTKRYVLYVSSRRHLWQCRGVQHPPRLLGPFSPSVLLHRDGAAAAWRTEPCSTRTCKAATRHSPWNASRTPRPRSSLLRGTKTAPRRRLPLRSSRRRRWTCPPRTKQRKHPVKEAGTDPQRWPWT